MNNFFVLINNKARQVENRVLEMFGIGNMLSKVNGCVLVTKAFARVTVALLVLVGTAQANTLPVDESCMVSVLSRTTQAQYDGTWQMDNIPSFMGQVHARANCRRGGTTQFEQTGFTNIIENQMNYIGDFEVTVQQAVPHSLTFDIGNNVMLFEQGTFFELQVFAYFPVGSQEDVTSRDSDINNVISIKGLHDGDDSQIAITVLSQGDLDEFIVDVDEFEI